MRSTCCLSVCPFVSACVSPLILTARLMKSPRYSCVLSASKHSTTEATGHHSDKKREGGALLRGPPSILKHPKIPF
jgi:hypothetical protein